MSVKPGRGPVFDPGLCRCCGSMKKCRLLNVEYDCLGRKEVYVDMIMDCYGFLISYLDGKPTERLICATCVGRLREALSFRKQVLQCEEAFLAMRMDDSKDEDQESCLEQALVYGVPKIEVEVVKLEPEECGEDSLGCDTLADDVDEPIRPVNEPDVHDAPDVGDVIEDNNDVDVDDNSSTIPYESMRPAMDSSNSNEALSRLRPRAAASVASDGSQTYRPLIPKIVMKKPKLSMSSMQEINRERDPTYKSETNILTIMEFSYVCPFKCRHNHLICYYCGQNFSDPDDLREHTLTLHPPKKFKVIEHKNMIKADLTRIDCRLCDAKIANLDDFKRHIAIAHKKKYYFDHKDSVLPFKLVKDKWNCAICDVCFPYFHALNKHMNEHFSNYVCELCGLGFVDKGRFMMHQQRHDEGQFPCQTCGKVFKAQYNRDLHVDRVHKKRGRVYCPKCDVKLMSYHQKLKHLVEVHGDEPLSFPCNTCERVFDTRRTLTIHRRKVHLKDFRYECEYCGQKFFTRFALNNHMPSHTGERNFKCKVCEKAYPRLKTLKDHMRIHTNDRRYRCHICGQAFIQNCSLKGHLKSQHPEYG